MCFLGRGLVRAMDFKETCDALGIAVVDMKDGVEMEGLPPTLRSRLDHVGCMSLPPEEDSALDELLPTQRAIADALILAWPGNVTVAAELPYSRLLYGPLSMAMFAAASTSAAQCKFLALG